MKRGFYIVGRERRCPEPTEPPEGRERRAGNGHYIGLRDHRVSRRHAEIYRVGERIFLRDLASTNGTYLIQGDRKRRITEGCVDPEHVVSFGGHRAKISSLLAATNDGGDNDTGSPA